MCCRWGSLIRPNLTQLESVSVLPHPVNNRRSISIYGMCEARGDTGARDDEARDSWEAGAVGDPAGLSQSARSPEVRAGGSGAKHFTGHCLKILHQGRRSPLPCQPLSSGAPKALIRGSPDQGNDRGLAGPVHWWRAWLGRVASGWG